MNISGASSFLSLGGAVYSCNEGILASPRGLAKETMRTSAWER